MTLIAPRSASRTMSPRLLAGVFLTGIVIGYTMRGSRFPTSPQETKPPFQISELPDSSVSHNPEIKKKVLVSYMQMPHVTQVARASIKPGQVASENWHKDMTELFIFETGEGMLQLDDTNHSIKAGSLALVHPPTRHTIYNTGKTDAVDLYVIASVP